MRRNLKAYISGIVISSLLSSSIVGSVIYSKFSSELQKQSQIIQNLSNNKNYSSINTIAANTISTGGTLTIPKIVKKVAPSIVGIRMNITIPNRINQVMSQSKAEGSGIIYDKNGYIMTNYHVVEYADPKNSYSKYTTLEVFLPDGRQTKAKFIGGDRKNDLAVIKIELDNLPVAELGDSSTLEVGETAVAIGNPLGMEFAGSVTSGIISAINRKVQVDDRTLNLIQTDAAINPGNSGGALVNSQGQVIGINTVKISSTGLEGLGFAIPINDAKPIVDQLMMFGYVKGRPFIGISGREITETISQIYNIPQGIYIMAVTSGSGAYKAGIRQGDIILKIAGVEVKTLSDIENIKSKYKAGDTVDVLLYRNGKQMTVKMTFSEER
ncbi:Serine protease Do-like HtrA [Caloramator mitchellensis]|uniref:Serine protease Do-like HtrA n=1 Tax=Caloramator mitchellensis TaxID=908809 RepID=A0A0R3JTA3_CALMK|nr:trypsin-like peptidase domain-containing protein [Caloramator mitchellensis]KRQ86758.1 Serine protease Do-like HtrA [Caloramator mitchellensis]